MREPRAIYVPIFDSFFESSIMQESVVTRFVFLALVRLAWRPRSGGIVDVDLRTFSAGINIPYEEVKTAINRLMQPDPESGSKLEEGRRIVPVDPERPMRCWRLVNWAEYKKLLHRSNDKTRKANERSRDKSGQSGQNPHVTHDTIRYDTIQEEKKESTRERVGAFVAPTAEEVSAYAKEKGLTVDAAYFVDFFEAKGWMTGKVRMKSWRAAARNASRDGWTIRQGTNSFTPAPNPTQNHEAASNDRQAEVARELAEERRLRKEMGR